MSVADNSVEPSAAIETARNEAVALAEKLMAGDKPEADANRVTVSEAKPSKDGLGGPGEAPRSLAKESDASEGEGKEAKSDSPPEEENKLAVVLRAKKQAQRIREESTAQAEARQRELDERQRKLEERERSIVGKLREKPVDALRELGIDPRDFFERAVEDPKQLDPMAQLKADIQAMRQELQRRDERDAQRERQAQEQARTGGLEAAKREFVSGVFGSAEKYPVLNAMYAGQAGKLANEALALVKEFTERGGDPNDVTDHDIAAFLEKRERDSYISNRDKLEQVLSGGSAPAAAVSLTNKDSSAKVARTKKTAKELDGEEGREAALRLLEERFEESRKRKTA